MTLLDLNFVTWNVEHYTKAKPRRFYVFVQPTYQHLLIKDVVADDSSLDVFFKN